MEFVVSRSASGASWYVLEGVVVDSAKEWSLRVAWRVAGVV